jgi:hypothetical protein
MRIKFSRHAKERLTERKISEKLVIEAIKTPDEVIITYRDRRLFKLHTHGKILEVVAVEEKGFYEVVTAYYIEEEKQ